jgi:hypothetical protein
MALEMDGLNEEEASAVEALARRVAREEIASLAGLVLRRLQDDRPTRSFERNAAEDVLDDHLSRIFGEVLADFGGHTMPGHAPGEED